MISLGSVVNVLQWYRQRNNKGENVGLFITLPLDLAKQFPSDGKESEDSSPSHVTFLYIGDMPLSLEDRLLDVVKKELSKVPPFTVKLGPVKKFKTDEHTVTHSTIKSPELHTLHDMLKRTLWQAGVECDNTYPEYKPHCTIEYIKKGDEPRYGDVRPKGKWLVDHVWIWGTNEPHIIFLKQ